MKNLSKGSTDDKKKRYLTIILSVIFPILLMLGGVLIAGVFLEKKKSIAIEIQTNKQLFPIEKRIKPRINSLDIEEFLDKLNFITICLTNNGKIGINGKTDIVKDLEIIFPNNYRIIGEPAIVENQYDVEIKFDILSEENIIKFWFDLLNPKQSITMDILYIGDKPVKPTLKKPKIVNLDKYSIKNIVISKEEERKNLFSTISVSFIFLFMIGFVSVLYILFPAKKKLEIVTSFSLIIFLFINFIIYYFRIIRMIGISLTFNTLLPLAMIIFSVFYGLIMFSIVKKKRKKREEQLKQMSSSSRSLNS